MKTWEVCLQGALRLPKENYAMIRFAEGPAGATATLFWQRKDRRGRVRNGYTRWPIGEAPARVQELYFSKESA